MKACKNLWKQSLLAINDDAVLQLNRVACLASKLCSHKSPTCIHSFCVRWRS